MAESKYPKMHWDATDLSEEFKLFKQRMELTLLDNKVTDKPTQARKIQLAVGNKGLRTINDSGLSTEDVKDPAKLWKIFEDQLSISINFRIHRLELMQYKQGKTERIDDFVNRCRNKATYCDFRPEETAERIVELVIASTPFEQFRKDLLDKPKGLSVPNLLAEGRKYQAMQVGGQRLDSVNNKTPTNNIDSINFRKSIKDCKNCGSDHPARKCPAYHDICKSCGSKGHWAKKCRKSRGRGKSPPQRGNRRSRRSKSRNRDRNSSPHRGRRGKFFNEVTSEDDEEEESEHTFYDIRVSDLCLEETPKRRTEAFTDIDITCPEKHGQHKLMVKLDTGAQGDTLPLRTIKQMYGSKWKNVVQRSRARLKAYNGTRIACLGKIRLQCMSLSGEWTSFTFYVVDVSGPAVAGLRTCEQLGLVTINAKPPPNPVQMQRCISTITVNTVGDLKVNYPDQFDRIGHFKEKAKLHLVDNARPSIDAPRKYPVHLKSKLKEELHRMEQQGIIRKITHHTDWCSSITTSVKKDGSLRVCLDPKRLNSNLKRCPHKIPTLEEINPQLAKAKYFSKMDAKAGYWSIPLAEESQELTTFRTPFGRYCFQRLPFGLSVSQDIFQQEMDRIIEQVPGSVCIADDIVVFGSSEKEHNDNLIQLLEVSKAEGLVFNSAKCTIGKTSISFFGSTYTTEGIKPDSKKIEDIKAMPTPQDKEDLQRFLGMINYIGSYIPHLAEKANILRDLLKKDVPFQWEADHQTAYEELKALISADTCLQYYDTTKPTILEVDASQKGLGACLIQNNKPIAFASKSLSEAQSHYSNIERETLALVYGIRRFHTYLFGREFTVESDHKPLEMITKKPLSSAPPRLKRLLVKLQGYTFNVRYKPGKEMVLSDTLSRLPNPQRESEIPLDIQVESITFDEEFEDTEDDIRVDLVHFGKCKQDALQEETTKSPTLRALSAVITNGWPDYIKDLPKDVRPYWSCRDELGMSNGVIFKGSQVVVPETLRNDMLNQLHIGHMGIEKTRRLARHTIYWPGINRDIEVLVKSCTPCQEHQPSNQKEPLEPHDIPSTPWTKLATDLFSVKGDDYILITDYHSKYPILHKLPNTRSETISRIIATTFSMFGIPKEIVSDNGPQYTGQAFQEMCNDWGITHTTSSPRFPQSNGLAERTVRTVKAIIKKCAQSKQDLQIAMLNLRATPIDAKLPSPAELLFGRRIRTVLPSHQMPTETTEVHEKLEERRERMKTNHDKHCGPELPPLHEGQKVRVQDQETNIWTPAEVTKPCDQPRSYEITTPSGSCMRRNRSQIRAVPTEASNTKEKSDQKHKSSKRVRFAPEVIEHSKQSKEGNNHPQVCRTRSGRIIRKPTRYTDE